MNINAQMGAPVVVENLERWAKQEKNPVTASRFETLALLLQHIENDKMWHALTDAGAGGMEGGSQVKARRIKIKKGEECDIYFVKRSPVVKYYASVDASGNGVEQKIVHPGIRANLTLVGPMTICMVTKKLEK